MEERPIPNDAHYDPASVELLRIWLANRKTLCSLKIGVFGDSSGIAEERAWGIILADITRHVANALSSNYRLDVDASIRHIRESFERELSSPSSPVTGEFSDGLSYS